MMRTALTLLEDSPRIDAWEVAHSAGHDTGCGCDDPDRCFSWEPARSAVVSARRALHRLADLGLVELRMENVQYRASIHYLTARKRCPDVVSNIEATHSFTTADTPT